MLKNKVAVITGSTSGIGLGVAKSLAKEGVHIMLNGFGDPAQIAQLQDELSQYAQSRVLYDPADMRKADEIATLIENTHEKLGSVDIVVNNAGIQHTDPVQDFPKEKWDDVLAINLSSSFHTIRGALPKMQGKGWGRIINVASAHGLVASQNKAAYVAAKHGLVGLTKVTALENAGSGITCNAICPGWVLTPLVAKQIEARAQENGNSFDEAKIALLSEKQPSKEFVTPDQIGAFAVFLCSEAAAQITGAALSIDGGWTAQ